MRIVIKSIKFFVFALIGAISVVATVSNARLNDILNTSFQVQSNQEVLLVYKSDFSKMILKISPFDDYYYEGDKKAHIFNTDKYSKETRNDILDSLKTLLNDKKSNTWAVEQNGKKIEYVISQENKNSIRITRNFRTIQTPSAIGQSIVICQTCLVVDDKNRLFLPFGTYSVELLTTANSIGLTPVILNDKTLPVDIMSLTVLDNTFNKQFEINTIGAEELSFDSDWRILEVKTPTMNETSVSEEVILFQ